MHDSSDFKSPPRPPPAVSPALQAEIDQLERELNTVVAMQSIPEPIRAALRERLRKLKALAIG